MELIDKDAVIAEIERRKEINKYRDTNDSLFEDEAMLSFINTLEVKEVDIWKTVDNINLPQADRNKIYCVLSKNKLSKNKYLVAKVINHPHDELLQWSCMEFPFRRYDMCEGDKYMQIV